MTKGKCIPPPNTDLIQVHSGGKILFDTKKYTLHGSFAYRKTALSKQKKVGGFTLRICIKGKDKFIVLKRR
jgi:hypothetical protein